MPATTQMQSNWGSPFSFHPGADFSETTPNFAGNFGFIDSDPGTWSETTVPEPSTYSCIVGLVALLAATHNQISSPRNKQT